MLVAAGQYLKVDYPASTVEGELRLAVTYTLWIPDGVNTFRGIIVLRKGKEFAQEPEKPLGKFGRPFFQSMTYHATPMAPPPDKCYMVDFGGSGSY